MSSPTIAIRHAGAITIWIASGSTAALNSADAVWLPGP
jgi:hypothetical protein